jgi:uncharacterized protein YndB with AHSA1/START domain
MSDKFEKTFEFAVPLERVWQAFTDPKELDAWYPGSIKGRRRASGRQDHLADGRVRLHLGDSRG